ncbi:MAG: hypothetical protein ACLUES_12740 [Flavonifractor plautii]
MDENKMGKGALMMNQNANEILSAGAKPPLAGEHVWPGAESDWRGKQLLERRRSFHMRLLKLIGGHFAPAACAKQAAEGLPSG